MLAVKGNILNRKKDEDIRKEDQISREDKGRDEREREEENNGRGRYRVQREESLARGNLVVKRASQQLRINWNVVEGGGREGGGGGRRSGVG